MARTEQRGLTPQAADAIGGAVPIIALIGFFASGFALDGWAWAWLWWMLIPLVRTLLPGFTQRRPEVEKRRELKRERSHHDPEVEPPRQAPGDGQA